MCGAHILPFSWQEMYEHYSAFLDELENARLNFPPHYNLRPTLPSAVITNISGRPVIEFARWGLIPFWWKQEKPPGATFNARREAIEEQLAGKRGMWGPAMRSRRCLVISGGFYEWTGPKTDRVPWYIHLPERAIISFAGMTAEHNDYGPSYTIITGPATEHLKELHHRMPLMVKPEHYGSWLSANTTPKEALAIIDDNRNNDLVFHRVAKELVNKQKNVPECLDEVAA